MIELNKGYRVQIIESGIPEIPNYVTLAFIRNSGGVVDMMPDQARVLAAALIKAAYLADAKTDPIPSALASAEAETYPWLDE